MLNILTENFTEIEQISYQEELKNLLPEYVSKENQDMGEELVCVICMNIVYDPLSCSKCQTLFCSQCIKEWLRLKIYCPIKCQNVSAQPIHKKVKDLLSKIKIKCPRNSAGCKESPFYENLESHLKNCEILKFRCVYCFLSGSKTECLEHAKTCKLSFATCENCGGEYKKKRKDLHTYEICVEKITTKMVTLSQEIIEMKQKNQNIKDILKIYKFPFEMLKELTIPKK
jgi:hypothetical protein